MQQITAVHPKLQRNLCNGRTSIENGSHGTLFLSSLIGKTLPFSSQPFLPFILHVLLDIHTFPPIKYYFLNMHVLIVKLDLQLLLPLPTTDFHSLISEEGFRLSQIDPSPRTSAAL